MAVHVKFWGTRGSIPRPQTRDQAHARIRAILNAATKLVEKAKAQAADLLEAATDDIDFADGIFRVVGTDRTVNWADLAAAAFDSSRPAAERGLSDEDTYTKDGTAYPNGCHIAEIEIDPATGVRALAGEAAILEAFKPGTGPNLITSVIGVDSNAFLNLQDGNVDLNAGRGGLF